MFCDQDDEWQYLPVETADEVTSCGDITECKRLENWNRWLKIRKQQHEHLGLMVCRSPTSLLMNKSDKYRSIVECKWMINQAQKLKINNEYTRDYPHSFHKEIQNFTSIYIPDIIRTEKGMSCNVKRDVCDDFETQISNMSICRELHTLKYLRPAKSPEKLAIVGKNIRDEIKRSKCNYKGSIPLICIEPAPENEECDNDALIIVVRINDLVTKSINNNSNNCETFTLNINPINTVKVDEDFWDEIIIENCSQISIRYKWEKEEYDNILERQPVGCLYFDTRMGILGPGQVKRLKVLFRPKTIGFHRETWQFQVEILGRLDPIVRINVSLLVCAVTKIDIKAIIKKIQNDLEIKEVKTLCDNLVDTIVQNIFPKSNNFLTVDKYLYHDYKMQYLYRITRTEKPLSIDELLSQCMRLEQSFREKFLDVISQTAVTLLKKNVIFKSGRTNQHELNAYKAMYVAIDCIDLTMNAYEPDYDEVLQELNTKLTNKNLSESSSAINENDISEDRATSAAVDHAAASEANIAEHGAIRDEWLDTMKPMIHKRLEWAVENIADYDVRWTEREHEMDDDAKKDDGDGQREHGVSLVGEWLEYFTNGYGP